MGYQEKSRKWMNKENLMPWKAKGFCYVSLDNILKGIIYLYINLICAQFWIFFRIDGTIHKQTYLTSDCFLAFYHLQHQNINFLSIFCSIINLTSKISFDLQKFNKNNSQNLKKNEILPNQKVRKLLFPHKNNNNVLIRV